MGTYIDANKLYKGIYGCDKPFLYSKDETIDRLVKKYQDLESMIPPEIYSNKYINNLRQCYLCDIEILFTDL